MNENYNIRRATAGDEQILAYIQTESWKAAFQNILEPEDLEQCTNLERATAMYQKLLDAKKIREQLDELSPHGGMLPAIRTCPGMQN